MFTTKAIITLAAAFLCTTNAAVVDIFSDEDCTVAAGTRNVFDNTCAPTGGFSSFRITAGGGSGQFISAFSPNDCVGTPITCTSADNVGGCLKSDNGAGASNALGSGPGSCVI